MALRIASLNSGSNGNCYYVGNGQDAVLVDAGISCRELEKRMALLGLSLSEIRAVFVSHEHSDHIRGVEVLSRKYRLPVYITPATLQQSRLSIEPDLCRPFRAGVPEQIGSLRIDAFIKYHDAIDPYSFTITGNDVCIGVFTDIGRVCDQLKDHFVRCHAVFLEANYDEAMLEQGRYPYHLKKRIRGGNGHLSNTQALELFTAFRSEHLSHLLLSHLSRDNNDPELVHRLFRAAGQNTEIVVASRYEASAVYTVTGAVAASPPSVKQEGQLSLF